MLSLPTKLDWPISFHHGFNNVTTTIKIFAGKWASGSVVMVYIINWKGNLCGEGSSTSLSGSSVPWGNTVSLPGSGLGERQQCDNFSFCCCTSCVGVTNKEVAQGQSGAGLMLSALVPTSANTGLLMEPQPKQISKHMSCQSRNESGSAKDTVIPWEGKILGGLLLSIPWDCPSPSSEAAMGPLQL